MLVCQRNQKAIWTSTAEVKISAIGIYVPVLKHIYLLIKKLTDDLVTTTIGTDSQPFMIVITSKEDRSFKNKYFGTKALRIRNEIKGNRVNIFQIKIENNIANILTKPVTYKKYNKLTSDWIVWSLQHLDGMLELPLVCLWNGSFFWK